MKVIFDENVPLPLQQFLAGHLVTTVQQEGWTGTENGDLLKLVDGKFDVLLLADKNLRYQQNLTPRRIALVELPTNRWPALNVYLTKSDRPSTTPDPAATLSSNKYSRLLAVSSG